jgi:hypothetical protein
MEQPPFSLKMFCRQVVLLLGALLLFAQCKKEASDPRPGWYRSPASYIYDVEDSSGNKESATQLETHFEKADPNNFRFFENSPDVQVSTSRRYFGLDQLLFTSASDGLYGEAAVSCNISLFYDRFTFLAVPAKPVAGANFPLYACGRGPKGSYTVVQTDTVLTVPAGTFQTFRLRHENGDQSWWNLEKGIIQFQTSYFDSNNRHGGNIVLRLRKIVQR